MAVQDFSTFPAQRVAGSFKALWESRRVDFEREVCFVIACVAFSTGDLDVRDLKYDELVMDVCTVNSRSESCIRRSDHKLF